MGEHVAELPAGTLTFLFTDLEGSTALWEAQPDAMRDAVARHDELLASAVETNNGEVVKTTGDGLVAVFAAATDGVAAALACQQTLAAEDWTVPLKARMGLYTGEAAPVDGDYHAPVLNRAARVMSAGHGGQVLLAASTAGLVRGGLPDGAGLVDLGEHRLRDLGAPEVLFQLTHPDLAAEFAVLRTLDALPGNLPLQVSSFVGREREMARVRDALALHRVVTLTGVGGVGKTRLALQTAAELLPRFRDGAWLVDLAPVRDAEAVAQAVASVFGISGSAAQDAVSALERAFASKQVLLVLDNCEHLIDGVADLVSLLVGSSAGLAVLATSREGLAIDAEQLVPVPPLAARDVDSAAVELFVDRARRVDPDFAVTSENAAAVLEVCRRLDGVPLAIELAAARVIAFGPTELARRLDRRLDMLAGGRRGAIERHATLRAAIDWSFELLDEAEQVLLCRLSVFAGSFDLDAVEATCSGGSVDAFDVFDMLTGLVSRSLVVAERVDAGNRFRLLETIRQYGEEQISADEVNVLRAAHGRYYVGFLRASVAQMAVAEDVAAALRRTAETPNLLAACQYAIDHGDIDTAIGLTTSIHYSWMVGETRAFPIDAVLELPGVSEHPDHPLVLMFAAFRLITTEPDAADTIRARAEQAMSDAAARGRQPMHEYYMRIVEGNLALSRGHFTRSANALLESAAVAGEFGLHQFQVTTLTSAVWALVQAGGDLARARDIAEEALSIAARTSDQHSLAYASTALATTLARSDPATTRRHLIAALEIMGSPGHELPPVLMQALSPLLEIGEFELASSVAARALWLLRWNFEELYAWPLFITCARTIADHDPETAATLIGAAYASISSFQATPPPGASSSGDDAEPTVYTGALRDARAIVTKAIGSERANALRARGLAMSIDQASAYALDHIKAPPILTALAPLEAAQS